MIIEPFIAHSKVTNEIYIVCGAEKYLVTGQVIKAMQNTGRLEQPTCEDCKHWKDSDGVYRRGIGAESKCPVNIKEVYEGNFYCKYFEKRGSEDGSN